MILLRDQNHWYVGHFAKQLSLRLYVTIALPCVWPDTSTHLIDRHSNSSWMLVTTPHYRNGRECRTKVEQNRIEQNKQNRTEPPLFTEVLDSGEYYILLPKGNVE